MAGLHVGRVFTSYEEFHNVLLVEQSPAYVWVKKQAKSVVAANKSIKHPGNYYPSEWGYVGVTVVCKHYGNYDSKGVKGKSTDTFKTGCGAKIRLQANKSKKGLVITEANLEHSGHEEIKSVEAAMLYPERRVLNEEQKKEMKLFLDHKVTVPRIIDHFKSTSGLSLNPYDVRNHRQKLENSRNGDKTEDELTRDVLEAVRESDPGASVDIIADPDTHEAQIISVQTKEMKEHFMSYPSVLFLDGTYKVNNRNMPLYTFMIVDGNHHGQVVSYALVIKETVDILSKLLQILAKNNETAIASLKTVVVDKDYAEINSVKNVLPNVNVVLCKWHVDRAVQRQMTGMPSEEKENVLKIIRGLLASHTEAEYDELHAKLSDYPQMQLYFNSHWHPIREQWAGCFVRKLTTFGNLTNNFVESHNHKLKFVLSSNSSIPQLIVDILKLSQSMSGQSKVLKNKLMLKKSLISSKSGEIKALIQKIYSICTPYAARIVKHQAELMSEKVYIVNEFEVKAPNGKIYNVGGGKCTCYISECQHLLCAHIMAHRRENGCEIIQESDFPDQHLRSHYIYSQGADEVSGNITCSTMSATKKILSQTEKYKKAFGTVKEIADVLSNLGQSEFNLHLEMFSGILNAIKENKNVSYFVSDNQCVFVGPEGEHRANENELSDEDEQACPVSVIERATVDSEQLSSCDTASATVHNHEMAVENNMFHSFQQPFDEDDQACSVSVTETTVDSVSVPVHNHEMAVENNMFHSFQHPFDEDDQACSVSVTETTVNSEHDTVSAPVHNREMAVGTAIAVNDFLLPLKVKKQGRPKQNKKIVAKRRGLNNEKEEKETVEKMLRDVVSPEFISLVLSKSLFIDSSMLTHSALTSTIVDIAIVTVKP